MVIPSSDLQASNSQRMNISKKESFFVALFNSMLFGVLFTFVGGFVSGQPIDWSAVLVQTLAGTAVGIIVGMVVPAGQWGGALASMVARPGTLLFKFVMYSILLVIMLIFMCPILTVFMGCVLGGAPIMAVLPGCYSLFVPFYISGIITLVLVGDFVTQAAIRCAHIGEK